MNDIRSVWDVLLGAVTPVDTERMPLTEAFGRVLAETVVSPEDVPAYARSAFDGYAFRAADTARASNASPAVLRILEEIPAGKAPTQPLSPASAAKILTGAPMPAGADAVVKYEETSFTKEEARVFRPLSPGAGLLPAGSDLRHGETAVLAGTRIGAAEAAALAALGYASVTVYRKPRVGVISTGSELIEIDAPLKKAKMRGSNAYMLAAALAALGCDAELLGIASDSAEDIAGLIFIGLADCDMLLLTGGVSAGDYDLTPAAMETAGASLLLRRPSSAPGGACACGVGNGRLIAALSGNPGAALIHFRAFTAAAVKKLCGYREPLPHTVTLESVGPLRAFKSARLVPGKVDMADGRARIVFPERSLSPLLRLASAEAFALVPPGEGVVPEGTPLTCLIP